MNVEYYRRTSGEKLCLQGMVLGEKKKKKSHLLVPSETKTLDRKLFKVNLSKTLNFSLSLSFFFFLAALTACGVPGPGIKPVPQQ